MNRKRFVILMLALTLGGIAALYAMDKRAGGSSQGAGMPSPALIHGKYTVEGVECLISNPARRLFARIEKVNGWDGAVVFRETARMPGDRRRGTVYLHLGQVPRWLEWQAEFQIIKDQDHPDDMITGTLSISGEKFKGAWSDVRALPLKWTQDRGEPEIMGLPREFDILPVTKGFKGNLFSVIEWPIVVLKDKPTVRLLIANQVKGVDYEDTQCSLLLKKQEVIMCF
jgi:hypothetical protein